MNKFLFLFANLLFACILLACNNQATKPATNTDSTKKSTASTPSQWSENEKAFMNDCVENANPRYNNDSVKAFAFCKCMMEKVKAKYNIDDTTTVLKLQQDTTAIKQWEQSCTQ